ncbi:MAG: transcriptional repressor [Deltaproteobacteria bacterium]|nr:transcriptional repressor [Deltaproteobacteria bacterium]
MGVAATHDALHARLDAYIEQQGLRQTGQRRTIADAFFGGPSHITIEELLSRARKGDPRIGYATVYRTLKLFTECGLAKEHNFGDGPARYELAAEGNDHHHDHLICLECRRIIEFHDEAIEALQAKLAERLGFEIASHKHEIYGTCEGCRKAHAKKRR